MPEPSPRPRYAVGAVFVFLLAALAYANTLSARYAWDDVSSFLFHEHVQDPAKFFQLFAEDQHAFGRGQGNFYRPLLSVTFMVDYSLAARSTVAPGDPAPLVFHLSSLLWHALAALGLYALLRRLNAAPWICVLVSAVFAVHPLHTEAIAYVSGRADSMSAAFMFVGLALALSPAAGRRGWAAVAGAWLCFVCALLSKESSFIFPVLLAICLWMTKTDAASEQRRFRAAALAGSLVLLGVYGALRMTVLRFAPPGGIEIPLTQRLNDAVQAFARYIELLFYPVNLHMQRTTIEGATMFTTVAGLLLLALCIFFVVAAIVYKQRRAAGGMAWFLAAWFPISGVFTLNAPMAEHWMYVPMAGFWLALAEMLPRPDHPWPIFRRSSAIPIGVAVSVWVLLLLGMTAHRNLDWRSSQDIFRATLADSPHSTMVHFNLALFYEGPGQNLPGARRHYQEMMRIFDRRRQQGTHEGYRTEEVEALYSLGNIAYLDRDYLLASRYYDRLVKEVPMTADTQAIIARAAFQLGKIYLESGRRDIAQEYLSRAVAVDPFLESELAGLGLRLR